MSASHTLTSEREIRAGALRGEVDFTVKKDRLLGGVGGQARRASLEEVEGSISG